jgi:hypothetical protein
MDAGKKQTSVVKGLLVYAAAEDHIVCTLIIHQWKLDLRAQSRNVQAVGGGATRGRCRQLVGNPPKC